MSSSCHVYWQCSLVPRSHQPEESAEFHQTPSSGVGSGHETKDEEATGSEAPQFWVPNFFYKGPIRWFLSFSSGASPAHNAGGQVLPLCIYTQPTDNFHERSWQTNDQRPLPCSRWEAFFWMLCNKDTFVSITFIAMLMMPIARLFNITVMCK